jgi:uroporphyrinogen decarboxylase
MMHASDDLGTQTGLLLSREIILEFLVPEYKRLFDFYNRNNVIIMFHSCGHIMPILDIFMDLGVDVLNPLQSSANDLAEVRRITQGKMALHGGVGSALLMDGPVDAIRNEAIRLMRLLGSNGGYFCAPDQGMPWPREHIEALNKAVDECGLYPLARG